MNEQERKIKLLGYSLMGQSVMVDAPKGGFLYVAGEQLANGIAPTGDVALMALGELIAIMEAENNPNTRQDTGTLAAQLLQLMYSTINVRLD